MTAAGVPCRTATHEVRSGMNEPFVTGVEFARDGLVSDPCRFPGEGDTSWVAIPR